MNPAGGAPERRKRLTVVGIAAEIAYVLGLSALCCFVCVLAFFAARWAA